jgi:hypothetical protein
MKRFGIYPSLSSYRQNYIHNPIIIADLDYGMISRLFLATLYLTYYLGRVDITTPCGYHCSTTTTSSNSSIQFVNNTNGNVIVLNFNSDIPGVFNTSFTVEGSIVNGADSNPSINIYTSMEDGIISSSLVPTNISFSTAKGDYIFTNGEFDATTKSFTEFHGACGNLAIIDPSSGDSILEIARFSFFGSLEARTFNSSNSDFAVSLLPWIQAKIYPLSGRYGCSATRYGRKD